MTTYVLCIFVNCVKVALNMQFCWYQFPYAMINLSKNHDCEACVRICINHSQTQSQPKSPYCHIWAHNTAFEIKPRQNNVASASPSYFISMSRESPIPIRLFFWFKSVHTCDGWISADIFSLNQLGGTYRGRWGWQQVVCNYILWSEPRAVFDTADRDCCITFNSRTVAKITTELQNGEITREQ